MSFCVIMLIMKVNDQWDEETSPVGSFFPNGYGIYDMSENVVLTGIVSIITADPQHRTQKGQR